MERTRVVIDTNVLLDTPEILLNKALDIVIPYVVLAELDKLKRNPDLSAPARKAIKFLKSEFQKGTLQVVDIPTGTDTNDEKIVQSAKDNNAKLLSNDVGANVIALTKEVQLFSNDIIEYDDTYIGYRYLTVDSEFYYKTINMHNEFQLPEIDLFIDELVKDNPININEYIIFKPDDNSANEIVLRRKEDRYLLVPVSNKILRGISNAERKMSFEFLHPEQAMAFDAVYNDDTPLAVIHGQIGSGKTLLSTVGALARVAGNRNVKKYDRILVTRPNRPINKQYELGFMPGDLSAKMFQWLVGFTSNLEFLFNNSQQDIENDTAQKVFQEYFHPIAIESIQGASYRDILIVDEAQLLDVDTLKQIMSRVTEKGKLILILDTRQTYGANRGNEGFKKLLPHIKNNPLVSYVDLQHIQRSQLTSFVQKIFE